MEFALNRRVLPELMTPVLHFYFKSQQEFIMFKSVILVGIGGFIGSALRYLISHLMSVQWQTVFPYGTFFVNLAGSFILGLVISYTFTHNFSQEIRLLLAVGFCGSFTTFSSFSYEFMSLLQNGHTGYAFLYAFGSLILGFLLVGLGFYLGK